MKRLLALTIIAASFAVAGTATAAGQYTHITTDENYLAADGTILTDPYGVGEGAGASHASIMYWGPQANGDDHYVLERQGGRTPERWPSSPQRSLACLIGAVSTMTPPRNYSPTA